MDYSDIEAGNLAKGLAGGAGPGSGDWRLRRSSPLDIEALAYLHSPNGFLTPVPRLVPAALAAPSVRTAWDAADRAVTLSWNAVEGATGYEYRWTPASCDGNSDGENCRTRRGTVGADTLSVRQGRPYLPDGFDFRVRAIRLNADGGRLASGCSTTVRAGH